MMKICEYLFRRDWGEKVLFWPKNKYRLVIANHKGSNNYLDFFHMVVIMLTVTKDCKSCFTFNLPRRLNRLKKFLNPKQFCKMWLQVPTKKIKLILQRGGEGYLTLALQLLCLLHLLYILFEHICKLLFNLCVKQALIQATNLENILDGPTNFKSSLIFIECAFSMSLLLILI